MQGWLRAVAVAAAEFARGIDTASAIRHGVPVTSQADRNCCADSVLPNDVAGTAAPAAPRN